MLAKSTRNALILLAAIAALVTVYSAAGFLGVPWLLRTQLEKFTTENYGRAATVGKIRFNPYTFELEIRSFAFPDVDRKPLLSFQRLFMDLELASIWRRGASFRAIELDHPFARVLIRRDRTLNLAEAAKALATPHSDDPTRLFVDRLKVSNGAVTFEDRTRATPFRAHLKPVTLDLRDFSTTENTANAYTLRGTSAAGERVGWHGTFRLDPLASRGRFELSDVRARTLWSYMQDSLPFEVSRGTVSVAGSYDFAAADAVSLQINVSNVDVSDLGIKPPKHNEDYVHLAQIKVENILLDLARERVDVGKVRLAGGDVRVWREADGRINLLELVTPSGATPSDMRQTVDADTNPSPRTRVAAKKPSNTPTPDSKAPASWTLSAPDIAVAGFKVSAEDRFVKPTASFVLEPIDVHVSGFSNAPDTMLDVDGSVRIVDSGVVKLRGKTVPERATFRGRVEVSDLDLTALQPYVSSYTQMTVLSGMLSTKLDVDVRAGGAVTVKGDTEVGKLRTIDNVLRQDFIKWDRLRASGIEFQTEPARLKISTIDTRGPYIRFVIAQDQTTNLSKVLTAPASAPGPVQTVRSDARSPNPVGAEQAIPVSIGTVRVANGSANFADFWIQPNYAVSIQALNGSIAGLSSEKDSRAKLKLEGKVDRYAPVVIEGDVNLLSAALYTDINMEFQGVELSSVTPYAGRFAGYRIEKGKLSVDLSYHVENRQLKAEQRFVIEQLQLGERVASPEAVRLPLRLAVALLKDRNGVIDIGLPVSGSLDDPKFRIGPIIWKAVVNLLTKIVTAPFALLGNMFGGGEEMNIVNFEPGTATLSADGQKKLDSLVKAMQDRPHLQLDVPATYSPEVDRPVLTGSRVNEKLLALSQELDSGGRKRKEPEPADNTVLTDPARRFELLLAQYRRDFGPEAALPATAEETSSKRRKKRDEESLTAANAAVTEAISEKNAVSDSDLEELGKARARAIQDALLGEGEIDPGRVFLIAANPKPPTEGKVRVELSLK